MQTLEQSFSQLYQYIESEGFKGYDPYDTLLSWIPFYWLGKYGPVLAIQIQKRNPVNIRPLIGIKKDYNPKAMGLFLHAFSILYEKTKKEEYKLKADFFFNWLKNNYSQGYSGYGWGYNFPWASPVKYLQSHVPSAVVTGFICKGIYKYYKVIGNMDAAYLIQSASDFILKDLPVFVDNSGESISYTPVVQDVCYNASLLAGEILAMNYALAPNEALKNKCINLVNFVVSRQKESGVWYYSQDITTGLERKQIDFHQGYILESIFEIKNLLGITDSHWENALNKGLGYYYERQFFRDGRSLWRIPREYPVEIHNQSQGIITFHKLGDYHQNYREFAIKIADWTIGNMQDKKGYFYYHKNKYIDHKISYMRWSQAWMFLALVYLKYSDSDEK